MKTRIHTPRRQRKPRCARGGALRALVAAALVAECMHACQTGKIIVICDGSHARNHHHLHPQKLLMLRPKAFWVCGRMARRLVGAVVPRSVHANLNMGLFLRAVLCSTTPIPAYKIDFRAQKSSKFSRGLRPRTPGRLPLLGRTCLSSFWGRRPPELHAQCTGGPRWGIHEGRH